MKKATQYYIVGNFQGAKMEWTGCNFRLAGTAPIWFGQTMDEAKEEMKSVIEYACAYEMEGKFEIKTRGVQVWPAGNYRDTIIGALI